MFNNIFEKNQRIVPKIFGNAVLKTLNNIDSWTPHVIGGSSIINICIIKQYAKLTLIKSEINIKSW